MTELLFIGLGLYNELDLTTKALQELKTCKHIFAEFYTSTLNDFNQNAFEHQIGHPIHILTREDTEKGTKILTTANKAKTALLVGGDPMMATTHIDLRIRAITQGITTKIIHNASIITAAPGLLGLQNYKFGRTTTLTYPEKDYFPMSPYEVINDNKNLGLHTLILLDIQADKNRYMTANEGITLLETMEKHHHKNIITPETLACVVARAGSPHPLAIADTIEHLQQRTYGPPLHTLIFPGNLHFMELEALQICADLPPQIALKLQKL
ncbi:MAG: diphthine synthase [Candidatus Thermoplasmatota archaeon]|nr:diphthine synthase [Candidatus Thermoplasmatota archaeon]MBU1941569.1 diphthine synthase [Candidatus Thermoplasmatota archaeon]